MEYVQRSTTRKILLFLLDQDRRYHAIYKKVGSTILLHLSWLRKALIISVRSGLPQTYIFRDKVLVAILMKKGRKSGLSC